METKIPPNPSSLKIAYSTIPITERTSAESTDLIQEIKKLKKEKDAIILAHNYQLTEVLEVADFSGDSYGLAKEAQKVKEKTIVFCGVKFMAETAYILNPDKTVLLPDMRAGCALAECITASRLHLWKEQHPGIPVVLYINSDADVKAESDVICTSSNALKITESLPEKEILLAPDLQLAYWVENEMEKKSKDPGYQKKIIHKWPGACPIHAEMTAENLVECMVKHPEARVIVHPECTLEVQNLAHDIMSTSSMIRFVEETDYPGYIIGTEIGLLEQLRKNHPEKKIFPPYEHKSCDESCVCPYMKQINLESVKQSLENNQHVITVPEDVRIKAAKAIERMLEIGM